MPGEGEFVPRRTPKPWRTDFLVNIDRPYVRWFQPRQSNGAAILVIPGGSYFMVSAVEEGARVAQRLAGLGYHAAVLVYRLPREGWARRADVSLQDAQRAMRVVRGQAVIRGFDPARVAVLGFSAGGHLAAMLATCADEATYPAVDGLDGRDARPAAAALIYPVVRMAGEGAHEGSRRLLLGPDPTPDGIEGRSPARHVDGGTPPLFLVHALDDVSVVPDHSLALLTAARAARVCVEAHLFATGGHGFGLPQPGAPGAAWPTLFHAWLSRRFMSAPIDPQNDPKDP